jgi:hypothetical protein
VADTHQTDKATNNNRLTGRLRRLTVYEYILLTLMALAVIGVGITYFLPDKSYRYWLAMVPASSSKPRHLENRSEPTLSLVRCAGFGLFGPHALKHPTVDQTERRPDRPTGVGVGHFFGGNSTRLASFCAGCFLVGHPGRGGVSAGFSVGDDPHRDGHNYPVYLLAQPRQQVNRRGAR